MGMFDYVELYYGHPNIRKEDISDKNSKEEFCEYQTKDLVNTCSTFEITHDGLLVQKLIPKHWGTKDDLLEVDVDEHWYFNIYRTIGREGHPTHKYKEEVVYIFGMLSLNVQMVDRYVIPYDGDCEVVNAALKKYDLF